jgi:hypothetical protein
MYAYLNHLRVKIVAEGGTKSIAWFGAPAPQNNINLTDVIQFHTTVNTLPQANIYVNDRRYDNTTIPLQNIDLQCKYVNEELFLVIIHGHENETEWCSESFVHLHTLKMVESGTSLVSVSTFHRPAIQVLPTGPSYPEPPKMFYKEYEDEEQRMHCPLKLWDCVTPGCRSTGLVGPLCDVCSVRKAGVVVMDSDFGCGLFASQPFYHNDIIIPYMGELKPKTTKASHIYSVSRLDENVVDAACKRSSAAFINHGHGDNVNANIHDLDGMVVCGVDSRGRIMVTTTKGTLFSSTILTIPWCLLPVHTERLWIVASCSGTIIHGRSELLLSYGENYWSELGGDTVTYTTSMADGGWGMCCNGNKTGCGCYQCAYARGAKGGYKYTPSVSTRLFGYPRSTHF